MSELNPQQQSKYIKKILYYLLPPNHDFALSTRDQIPKVAVLRYCLKRSFNMDLCNYATSPVTIENTDAVPAVPQLLRTKNETPNSNPFESNYGTVYTFKYYDQGKYDLGFQIYLRDHRIRSNYNVNDSVDGTVLNLPYPPRACIINKHNLIGASLNGELIAQINKLKQDCTDYEERESSTSWKLLSWVKSQSNTKILKQYIIDPLLNTNKYLIPSLFYIDKSKHNCDILTEINNCPRLYNMHLYDLIGSIFYKFISTIEYMLNLNDLDKQTIQVIVSCHNKILKPNTNYVGNLHREGFIDGESIQIGCIYYFDKSPCLIDDKIKNDDILQIVSSEPCSYSLDYYDTYETFDLNIDKHDCIVFNNSIMNHKVYKLTNKSNQLGHRCLLSFWLPKYKINSSRDIDVLYNNKNEKYHFLKVFQIVKNWVRIFNQQRRIKHWYETTICKNIENLISDYITSKEIVKYSQHTYATNAMDNADMKQLFIKRARLRSIRSGTKMKNECIPQWDD